LNKQQICVILITGCLPVFVGKIVLPQFFSFKNHPKSVGTFVFFWAICGGIFIADEGLRQEMDISDDWKMVRIFLKTAHQTFSTSGKISPSSPPDLGRPFPAHRHADRC